MARPGAGLLASGSSAAPSRGAVATPVAAIQMARDGCRPVTVAGPRRSFTGLPLATGRIWAGLYWLVKSTELSPDLALSMARSISGEQR
jgi:hypothetical protein